MNLDEFTAQIKSSSDEELFDISRKHVLHGTPHVFAGRDDDYYDFRKRISHKFKIPFHEVYIMGSAKLGFSPHKGTLFDLDSDIDVAIISGCLFEEIMMRIAGFQRQYRKARRAIQERELRMYHEFLEYVALGWIRPDKLPVSFKMEALKNDWFEFFTSISYGKSEVGNYKVSAGVFKSYEHLEEYIVGGFRDIKSIKTVRTENDPSD
ncbi:hypothetical protein [Prosthecochloris sp. SCSIO W1103]|uniref:hypothetical protein n=1 Tax=Prosthecochloris sp. SCSIO W1103 TaxID=2992244 RepID=UPI00223CF447|nr:hypothetical protein [Prosthecochloris sp. SCSIO W1103]UZJ36455.1 hypothetical protein OO005_06705 [Prosthecochloris sp. SCSIO W1103]